MIYRRRPNRIFIFHLSLSFYHSPSIIYQNLSAPLSNLYYWNKPYLILYKAYKYKLRIIFLFFGTLFGYAQSILISRFSFMSDKANNNDKIGIRKAHPLSYGNLKIHFKNIITVARNLFFIFPSTMPNLFISIRRPSKKLFRIICYL